MQASFQCPQCGSEDTRALSLLYAAGTSTSVATGVSTGFSTFGGIGGGGGGSFGFGGIGSNTTTTTMRGRQQTNLAAAIAPPARRKSRAGRIIFAGICMYFSIMVLGCGAFLAFHSAAFAGIGSWLCIGLVVFALVLDHRKVTAYNTQVWPGLMARWEASMLCQRCGLTFPRHTLNG